jgi:hypothetical protein
MANDEKYVRKINEQLKSDDTNKRSFLRKIWVVSTILFIATTFFPIYVPLHTTNSTTIYGIIAHTPLALIVPILFAVALPLSLSNKSWRLWLSVFFAVAGIATASLVNSANNTSVATPQPYTALALIAYFGAIPVLFCAYIIRRGARYYLRLNSRTKTKPAVVKHIRKYKIAKKTMTAKSLGILYLCLIMAELIGYILLKPKDSSEAYLVAGGSALAGIAIARCITSLLGIDYYSKDGRKVDDKQRLILTLFFVIGLVASSIYIRH